MKEFNKGDRVYVWNAELLEVRTIYEDEPIIGEILDVSPIAGCYMLGSVIDGRVYHVEACELYTVGTGPTMVLQKKIKEALTELHDLPYDL